MYTCAEAASQFQVALLLAEGSMLYGLQHQNLLPVLAVALPQSRGPPMLVYPLLGHGNLKRCVRSPGGLKQVLKVSVGVLRFLQSCRLRGTGAETQGAGSETARDEDEEEGGQCALTTQDLVHMALQVVLALMYLHGHRVCHRDVATRNCV